MATITVKTTSTDFGSLPFDISQIDAWADQHDPGYLSETIYQEETQIFNDFLEISNLFITDVKTNGYSTSLISSSDFRVTSGPITLDYYGSIGSNSSTVTQASWSDSQIGLSVTDYGNLVFPGLPFYNAANVGSNETAISVTVPNPTAASSQLVLTASGNLIWNGNSGFTGEISGVSVAIADTSTNKAIQFAYGLTQTPITVSSPTASSTGSFNLSTSTINGFSMNTTVYTTGAVTDSASLSGFSLPTSSTVASQLIDAAVTGNDTVSISGSGILNVIPELVADASVISSVAVTDSAANVLANLDALQSLAAVGKITSITLTDPGTPVLTVSASQATADAAALEAIVSPRTINIPNPGLLVAFNTSQQLELIYVAYFDRAADDGGFVFWGNQNVVVQNYGQSSATALTNIANSFTPQPETIALYPFLGTPSPNLNTPAARAGLNTFINSVYDNLFGRPADSGGLQYWVGQLTSGAVGLGAAALAIANGTTGADAIEVQNKINVAVDFTTRTAGAGLGGTAPLAASFKTAATSVLTGIDGLALNDASVTTAENATTTYITSATATHAMVSASVASSAPTMSFMGSETLDYTLGSGSETISNFQYGVDTLNIDLAGASNTMLEAFDTTVLGRSAIEIVSNADPTHGVVLLGVADSDNLMANHVAFSAGHAIIT